VGQGEGVWGGKRGQGCGVGGRGVGKEERSGVWGGGKGCEGKGCGEGREGRESGEEGDRKAGTGRREIGKLSNVMSTQQVARLHNSQDHLVPQDRTMEVVMTRVPQVWAGLPVAVII